LERIFKAKILEEFFTEWIRYRIQSELKSCTACDMARAAGIILSGVDPELQEKLMDEFLAGKLTLADLAKYSTLKKEIIDWLKTQVPFDKPFTSVSSETLE